MARTKGENKSKAIRNFMRKNRGATVPQIVDGLKAEGVTVTPTLVYNVRATAAKKKKVAKATASTSGAAGGTKADEIRAVAGAMEKPVRPRDVVAALRDKGIEVSRTQVSQVLTKMGMKRRRRRRKAAAGRSAPAVASNSAGVTIDDLVAAKKLVGQVGSIGKVREALAALARLS